jgi:23S rRNA (adenine2503-C2)-methyltransferase
MTNISIETRAIENSVINHIKVDTMQCVLKTVQLRMRFFYDGLVVESVIDSYQHQDNSPVSQVGCSLTVALRNIEVKRMRNLEPGEIYDQVLAIDKESRLYHNHPLSNVFMEWRAVDELQQYDESHRHDNFTRRLRDVS